MRAELNEATSEEEVLETKSRSSFYDSRNQSFLDQDNYTLYPYRWLLQFSFSIALASTGLI